MLRSLAWASLLFIDKKPLHGLLAPRAIYRRLNPAPPIERERVRGRKPAKRPAAASCSRGSDREQRPPQERSRRMVRITPMASAVVAAAFRPPLSSSFSALRLPPKSRFGRSSSPSSVPPRRRAPPARLGSGELWSFGGRPYPSPKTFISPLCGVVSLWISHDWFSRRGLAIGT